jgi:hypothetical protein
MMDNDEVMDEDEDMDDGEIMGSTKSEDNNPKVI